MEIVIGLLVLAAAAFYLIRKNKQVENELQATETAPKMVAPVVDLAPVAETVKVEAPVAEEKQWPMVETAAKAKPKAKKPAAPKAPAKPKAVPAKSTKAKAPAIKATPAKKPRAPKAK